MTNPQRPQAIPLSVMPATAQRDETDPCTSNKEPSAPKCKANLKRFTKYGKTFRPETRKRNQGDPHSQSRGPPGGSGLFEMSNFSLSLDPNPSATPIRGFRMNYHARPVDGNFPPMRRSFVGAVDYRRFAFLDLLLVNMDDVFHDPAQLAPHSRRLSRTTKATVIPMRYHHSYSCFMVIPF